MPVPPLPHSVAALPCLEPERIELLRDLCRETDPAALREMTGTWDTEVRRHLASLRNSQSTGDSLALKAAAHALKGTCGNMGVARLAELARLVELMAPNPPSIAALLPAIEREYECARRELALLTC